MFITIKKHKAIVDEIKSQVDLHKTYEELAKNNQKNNDALMRLLDRVTDKSLTALTADDLHGLVTVTATGRQLVLPNDVAVYVDDYFGGKCIKQESTPVTILDPKGKATYSQTAQKAKKGMGYILVQL